MHPGGLAPGKPSVVITAKKPLEIKTVSINVQKPFLLSKKVKSDLTKWADSTDYKADGKHYFNNSRCQLPMMFLSNTCLVNTEVSWDYVWKYIKIAF